MLLACADEFWGCQSSAARTDDAQTLQTTQTLFHYPWLFLLGPEGFQFLRSWHCAYWLFRPREGHTHQNRLLNVETMLLLGYFAVTSLQTPYELFNHCLLATVKLEVCTESCDVFLGVYYEMSSVALLSVVMLFVKICLGIGQNKSWVVFVDRTMLQVFVVLFLFLLSHSCHGSGPSAG